MDLNLNSGHPKTMGDKNTKQKTKQANKQTIAKNHNTTKDKELSYLLNVFVISQDISQEKN